MHRAANQKGWERGDKDSNPDDQDQDGSRLNVLIIGAGVIGSSVAMHLAKKGLTRIKVIDLDLEGAMSSSERNAGGVRATWNQSVNIEMSKNTLEWVSTLADQVGYRACGYLWLHPAERMTQVMQARQKQIQKGWPVELWDLDELRRKVPFLNKTEGVAGAIFAPRDGLINPNLLKNYFRSQARSLGVVFEDRTWLGQVTYSAQSNHRAQVTTLRFETFMTQEEKIEILSYLPVRSEVKKVKYDTQCIINCAGPWAAHVARILGYQTPSTAVRRQICLFDCRDLDLSQYGMFVDTTGVYFHSEASNVLAGFANSKEPPGINYNYDGESFFQNNIWPALSERSHSFEKLKYLTGWSGLYDVSPDECAIIGQVNYNGLRAENQVYEAHSFSGHGVMQSYCAGLSLAEKIVEGKYTTVEEAEVLAGSRFERGQLVHESFVI